MRRLALALLLAAGLAGCATTAQPGGGAPGTDAPSPTGCPQLLNLTQADSGTRCVALGGSVDVVLVGLSGQEWAKPQLSADGVLRSAAIRVGGLPSYTTFAGFDAAGKGTVDITSSRSACGPPSPGSAACHAQQGWRITVTVR
jgi:hypothetical protein